MQCQELRSQRAQLLELTRHRRRRSGSGYKDQGPQGSCFLAIPTRHCKSSCLSQGISRDKTALAPKNLRSQEPRTRDRIGGSQVQAPLFPKAPQAPARNGGETDRGARQGKRRQHQRPGSRGHGPDTSPPPEAAAPARQGPWEQARDEITRKAEPCRRSRAGAASRPRNLLENWMENWRSLWK
jgi:hypothetical protein